MTKPELQQKFEEIAFQVDQSYFYDKDPTIEAMKAAASLMLDLLNKHYEENEDDVHTNQEIQDEILKLKELL